MNEIEFITQQTVVAPPPLVPEISLHLATEITPLWQATETHLARSGIEPPFWAFAWPGSQLIARHVLDNPELIAGRRVLDFASGSGLAGIACAMAGAASVLCNDIDPMAAFAVALNAGLNNMAIETEAADLVGRDCAWDLILCGDICYNAPMAAHIMPWLQRCARTAEVWIADPGRAYRPTMGLCEITSRIVPTSQELEDRTTRRTTLYRVTPA